MESGVSSPHYNRAKIWQIGFFVLNNTATNVGLLLMGFYAFFTQNVLGLSAAVVGLIAMIMRIWDGLTDPVIGFILDRTNGKFGKFRPFMLGGNLILFLTIFLIFRTSGAAETTSKYIYTTILYVFYVIGYTFQTACTKGAQAALTNDPKQRPMFTFFDAIYNIVLFNGGTWFIMTFMGPRYEKNIIDPVLWRHTSVILMSISLVFTIFAIIGIWQKDRTEFFGIGQAAAKIKPRDTLDVIKNNRPLQMLIIAASTDKLALVAVRGALVYFFSNILLNSALQGTYSLWAIIPTVLTTIVGVRLAARGGLKKSFVTFTVLGTIMLVVMLIATPLLRADVSQGITAGVFILLVLLAVQVAMSSLAGNIVIPMIADCSDYETHRSGRFMPGMIGTLFSFVDKFISSLSTFIIGLAITAAGYGNVQIQPNTPVATSFEVAILFIIFGLPLIGHVASLIAMKFYKLDDSTMAKIKEAIYTRHLKAVEEPVPAQ
jgi:Na+/melibiose symporter-like transporter